MNRTKTEITLGNLIRFPFGLAVSIGAIILVKISSKINKHIKRGWNEDLSRRR